MLSGVCITKVVVVVGEDEGPKAESRKPQLVVCEGPICAIVGRGKARFDAAILARCKRNFY
jgi:hypothetical protein